ncbi:hypothetical protein ACFFTN_21080 [Aminobacter aganoensis]|uniref:Uncharacterized protein n=1 Tax=Aminobacter aganoensis TaxID=83264 RepID=A0A7X0FC37_9HYPH|nr:hypothetical protein [Aminobacter aganoensis]MBB6356936.1 hypothetical protein [Aminobacter aganoensis]
MSTRKLAAAEGMPEISRRCALMAGANFAIAATLTVAAVQPAPAAGVESEHPWVRARQLARELAATLAECDDGQCMAEIYPATASTLPVLFGSIEGSAESRLLYHAKAYARAARDIDPTAGEMWMGRAVDADNPHRFNIVIVREA